MWVECIDRDDVVLVAARRLADTSADRCFSVRELAADLPMDIGEALTKVGALEEQDWVFRWEDNLATPPTPGSRWGIRQHATLTVRRRCEVLEVCADGYRILDDRDDPVLFDPSCFRVVDSAEPGFWVTERGDENERYASPRDWARPGFFEDYYDGGRAVRDKFWNDLRRLYPRTWQERRGGRQK